MCGSFQYVDKLSLALSLHFNGHFPGEPGLASVYWSKRRWWRWWQLDYWSYKSCNHHHQQTNIQLFTGRMPFLSPNQQCQSTEGKNITFHGLAYPKLTWGFPTLSLTNNSSWLSWGGLPCLLSAVWCQYLICWQMSLHATFNSEAVILYTTACSHFPTNGSDICCQHKKTSATFITNIVGDISPKCRPTFLTVDQSMHAFER